MFSSEPIRLTSYHSNKEAFNNYVAEGVKKNVTDCDKGEIVQEKVISQGQPRKNDLFGRKLKFSIFVFAVFI